eukprot:12665380-Ditylum_brightwellii.AAC.1
MRKKGIDDPKPRKQWCNNMLAAINKWRKDREIVFLTVANSTPTEKAFSNFVKQAGLFDIIGQLHGMGGINSHVSGMKSICFVLGTYRLTRTIVKGGVLPFHQSLTSDQQAIFVDLNKHQLFKGKIHALYNAPIRK